MPIRFGAFIGQLVPYPELRDDFRFVESLGLEIGWIADHFTIPRVPDMLILEAWTTLAALAAAAAVRGRPGPEVAPDGCATRRRRRHAGRAERPVGRVPAEVPRAHGAAGRDLRRTRPRSSLPRALLLLGLGCRADLRIGRGDGGLHRPLRRGRGDGALLDALQPGAA